MPGAASLTMTTLLPNRRVWSEGAIYEGGAGDRRRVRASPSPSLEVWPPVWTYPSRIKEMTLKTFQGDHRSLVEIGDHFS